MSNLKFYNLIEIAKCQMAKYPEPQNVKMFVVGNKKCSSLNFKY